MTTVSPVLRIDTSGTAFGGSPTWTDYTSSLMAGPGNECQVTHGGQDETGVSPAECSFLLENADGRWTPGSATAPAGWNLGSRVSLRMTVNGTDYDRFDGYVDSVEPTWPGGIQTWSVVKVTATDVTARLGYAKPLRSMAEEEILADGPSAFWPLTEPVSSVSAGDISGQSAGALAKADSKYGAGTIEFAADGPSSDLTSVRFAHGSSLAAYTVLKGDSADAPTVPPYSVELWFVVDTLNDSGSGTPIYENVLFSMGSGALGEMLTLGIGDPNNFSPGQLLISFNSGTGFYGGGSSSVRVDDGLWHHYALTVASDGVTVKHYLDGALVDSATAAGSMTLAPTYLHIGGRLWGLPYQGRPLVAFDGRLSLAAFHNTELSAARVLAHYQAGALTLEESSDVRFTRIAGYGGVATGTLPTGVATMGTQQTSGKTVVEALQEVARTEGTVAYATPAGALTFQARNARYNATASLSLTPEDIKPPTVRVDRQGLMNQLTANRARGAAQTYVDATAQAADGVFDGGTFDVAPSTDFDALQNAAWQVETHKSPQVRIPALKIDLLGVPDGIAFDEFPALFPASFGAPSGAEDAMAVQIGTLVDLFGLPAQATSTDVSLFVEGWTETIGLNEWSIEFFTSPNLPTTLRADAAASTYTKLDNGLKIPF